MQKEIFGKKINIELDNSIFSKVLSDELNIYQDYSGHAMDAFIRIVESLPFEQSLTNNPRNYFELDDSIIFCIAGTFLRWYKNSTTVKVDVLHKGINLPTGLKTLFKLIDMQFNYSYQKAGQLFHELILIPVIYQLKNYSLIHGSAFSKGNKVYILGGTGGTGKTSLSMNLCRNKGFNFIADDILPITREKPFLNYAFPKIYAYNTVGNGEVEKEILKNDGLMGKIHWHLIKRLSLKKVRRRVNPIAFYNCNGQAIENKEIKYLILTCGNYDELSLKKIYHIEQVSLITMEIIKHELTHFNANLIFHKINSLMAGLKCYFDLDTILQDKFVVYNDFFANTENFILQIPNNLTHAEYLEQTEDILDSL